MASVQGADKAGGSSKKDQRRSRRSRAAQKAGQGDGDYVVLDGESSDDDMAVDLTADGAAAEDEYLQDEDELYDDDLIEDDDWEDEEGENGGGGGSRSAKKGAKGKKVAAKGASTRTRRSGSSAGGKLSAASRGKSRSAAGSQPPRPKKRPAGKFVIDDDDEDYDLEEEYQSGGEGGEGAYVLGAEDEEFHDFSDLELKPDHLNRPLWVCPDGRVFLETFSPVYKQAYDFLIAVAEPVSRPECIHEYMLTPHSLYAAVSIGLETATIISVLDRLSKTRLPAEIKWFVRESTENYGKVKLVLQKNAFFVESPYPEILRKLLKDEVIRKARVVPGAPAAAGGEAGTAIAAAAGGEDGGFTVARALKDRAVDTLAAVQDIDLTGGSDIEAEEEVNRIMGADGNGATAAPSASMQPEGVDGGGPSAAGTSAAPAQAAAAAAAAQKSAYLRNVGAEYDPDKETHSFEIMGSHVEHVKQRCLPSGLNYPMMEEYDFRGDTANPTLNVELKPHVKVRRK